MMRKIVYIICFLVFFSCANRDNAERVPSSEDAIKSEELKFETDGLVDDTKRKDFDFTFETINSEISEKLQANYEAQILAAKHPEFEEAIKEQLAGSTKFSVSLSDSIETIEVRNLSFYGKQNVLNDSISTQKMRYTALINSKYSQKDSVLVVIKRALILIDNAAKVNTSFTFEKLD